MPSLWSSYYFSDREVKNKCTFIGQSRFIFAVCFLLTETLLTGFGNSVILGVAGKHRTVGSYRGGEKGKWHWEPLYASFGKSHCATYHNSKYGILNCFFALPSLVDLSKYVPITQKVFNYLKRSNGRRHVLHSVLLKVLAGC